MKKMTMASMIFATVLSMTLLSARAEAQIISPYPPADAITIGQPIIGGTGCRDNSAELQFDGQQLSLHFLNFKTQLQGSKVRTERKNCSLRVPINIKPGYQLIATDLDVDGSVYRNYKFTVRTDASVGIIGGLSAAEIDLKDVGQKGLILIHKNLIDQDAVYTQCGQTNAMLALSTASTAVLPTVFSRAQLQSEIRAVGVRLALIPCHQ